MVWVSWSEVFASHFTDCIPRNVPASRPRVPVRLLALALTCLFWLSNRFAAAAAWSASFSTRSYCRVRSRMVPPNRSILASRAAKAEEFRCPAASMAFCSWVAEANWALRVMSCWSMRFSTVW